MRQSNLLRLLVVFLLISVSTFNHFAQNEGVPPMDITVVPDEDTIPSIVKALPDREKMQDQATRIKDLSGLKKALGDQKFFDLIDFSGGTEGITANYPAGKLLVIEFQTPQGSVDADNKIKQFLSETPTPSVFYRRIGNYSAFVLDGKDEAAALSLLDQVKYDKVVQWLGRDPNYLKKAEEYFVKQASQLFLSTVILIVSGVLGAGLLGIISGLIYFNWRNKRISRTSAFSDAGGMIRLNLDELSEIIHQ